MMMEEGKVYGYPRWKKYYTSIFAVVIMLATTDVIFALDSIPAVFGISTHRVVIYTSNIFAVLGLTVLILFVKRSGGEICLPATGYCNSAGIYWFKNAGRNIRRAYSCICFITGDSALPCGCHCVFDQRNEQAGERNGRNREDIDLH